MAQQDSHDHLCPPITAGDIKKNQIVILKGCPCKVVEIKTSKTGKHGHAKCNITGVDVVTGAKKVEVQPAHASMRQALVTKVEYQLLDVVEEEKNAELQLLDSSSEMKNMTVVLDDECKRLKEELTADGGEHDFIVTVQTSPFIKEGGEVDLVQNVAGFKKSS